MTPAVLTWRNLAGSPFRSVVVLLCASLMAGFAVSATLVIRGAGQSLDLALARLGADVIVIPEGTSARVERAFLMGTPAVSWMPEEALDQVAQVPGVTAVSPQVFLSTLRGATCCSVPEMFLIAYDPETDFTLRPWLEQHLDGGLGLGEAVGGSLVYLPAGSEFIQIYGYDVDLVGNLSATGSGLDQSMFFTMETAREIARLSPTQAEQVLEIPDGSISSVLVKVAPDVEPSAVAQEIEKRLPGVTAVPSSNMFLSQRTTVSTLLRSVRTLLGVVWVLAATLSAVVSFMSLEARRRQIGVLRALGATATTVLRVLVAEVAALAAAGGTGGMVVFLFAVHLFRHLISMSLGVPFMLPSTEGLVGLAILGGLGTVAAVTVAGTVPALWISRKEPAVVMRE